MAGRPTTRMPEGSATLMTLNVPYPIRMATTTPAMAPHASPRATPSPSAPTTRCPVIQCGHRAAGVKIGEPGTVSIMSHRARLGRPTGRRAPQAESEGLLLGSPKGL